MENFIIIGILLLIVVSIAVFLYKRKKRGGSCLGCPCSKECGGKCGSCNCNNTEENKR